MTETIRYQKCFIAYLDILGFKEKVFHAKNNQEEMRLLLDSLRICNAFASGGKEVKNDMGEDRTIDIQSRFFSDSIVFFLRDNPDDIGHLFFIVRHIQDRLWDKGLSIRGAITYDNMYFPIRNTDSNLTLGPGIIEAYKMESIIAIYPRITISDGLYDYIKERSIRAYPFVNEGELIHYIQQDKDGIYFLDLLNHNILRKKREHLQKYNDNFSIVWNSTDESNYTEVLSNVDKCIEDNISNRNSKIRQKYEWLKSYKNGSANGNTQA